MQIGERKYKSLALVDANAELVALLTDEDVINTSKTMFIGEEEDGELAFIVMDDNRIQCVKRNKDISLPKGNLNTAQFVEYSKNINKAPEKVSDQPLAKEIIPEDNNVENEENKTMPSGSNPFENKKEEPAKEEHQYEKVASIKIADQNNVANFINNMPPETLAALLKTFANVMANSKK